VGQNFEHIIKEKAIRLTAMINEAEGFKFKYMEPAVTA